MRIKLLLKLSGICLLILACAPSYAQVRKVTGKVTDAKSGQTLPGVTISVKDKQASTATNQDGAFTIQADPATDILTFSFIGYKKTGGED